MEVILLERIESLGQMGEVVKVKAGFARNFLLPQKKALRATDGNRKVFEERRAQLEAQNLERKGEASQVAKTLDGLSVVLVRAASESGQLYGSVTARDVADAITEAGVTVGRSQVRLDKALKQLGLEPVRVQLHPEVAVTVTVNIARTPDEAETQAKLGRALDRETMEDEFDRATEAAERTAQVAEEAPVEAEAATENTEA
ncbi:MAG: 50S ribosomal protein L9 [Thalassobaculum sp.]|uniref:50S ribosomal protein L9 n=1 Tax=Thalassobaculum sp. TaxID=2022740 RepID=UPI0032EFCFA4